MLGNQDRQSAGLSNELMPKKAQLGVKKSKKRKKMSSLADMLQNSNQNGDMPYRFNS